MTTTIHLHPDGDDQRDGRSAESAVRSLPHARDLARRQRRRTGACRVLLHDGLYTLDEPLVLDARDGGTAAEPACWEAAPGAQPVLSGGERLTGWTVGRHGTCTAWRLHLPEVAAGRWTFTALFVDGTRRERPCLPRQGTVRLAALPEDVADTPHSVWAQGLRTLCLPPEMRGDWHRPDDLVLMAYRQWIDQHLRLSALDARSGRVELHCRTWSGLLDETNQPMRARLVNVREALTEPGQWYLDRADGVLTYLPLPGEKPASTEVVAPRLPALLLVRGTVRRPVRHLRFAGLTFADSEWTYPITTPGSIQAAAEVPGANLLTHAHHVAFTGCTFTRLAGFAVDAGRGCHRTTVTRCHIHDCGAGAVRIGHDWLDRTDVTNPDGPSNASDLPQQALIAANDLHDLSRVFPSAAAVWIGNAGRCRVLANHIHRCGYSGISSGWTWGSAPTATVGLRIADNHIHHLNQDALLSDLGGIYTLGTHPGAIISGNHIHHVRTHHYGGWGLYADEGSAGITFARNLVHDCDESGFFIHYGRDLVLRDCWLLNNGKMPIGLGRNQGWRTITAERVVTTGTNAQPLPWATPHAALSQLCFSDSQTVALWQRHSVPAVRRTTGIPQPLPKDWFPTRSPWAGAALPRPPQCGLDAPLPDDDDHRPIVHLTLRCSARGAVRLTARNLGDRPARGTVRLSASPGATLGRSKNLNLAGLKPGGVRRLAATVRRTDDQGAAWVEAASDDAVTVGTMALLTRLPIPPIPLPVQPGAELLTADAPAAACDLRSGTNVIARLRLAWSRDGLLVHAVATDRHPTTAEPRWGGSCLELFASRERQPLACMAGYQPERIAQIVLGQPDGQGIGAWRAVAGKTVPEPGITARWTATRSGWTVTALIPWAHLGQTSTVRRLLFEATVTVHDRTGARLRSTLGGSDAAYATDCHYVPIMRSVRP